MQSNKKQTYYSQHGEDRFIERLINNYSLKIPRQFIDIGASDGRHANNCRRFADLEWAGAFIEPAPEQFAELKKNCGGYKLCQCVAAAVSDADGEAEFRYFPKNPDHSTLIPGKSGKRHTVTSMTYGSMLEKVNMRGRQAGIVSIDTEGLEVPIVKGMLQSKPLPVFVILESNDPDSRQEQIMLMNPEYHLITVFNVNMVWVIRRFYKEYLHPIYRAFRLNRPTEEAVLKQKRQRKK